MELCKFSEIPASVAFGFNEEVDDIDVEEAVDIDEVYRIIESLT